MKGLARIRESLPHTGWTLERFGLSPGKLPRRVFNWGAPKVLCVSIPKAGTHLLERAICLHPRLYRKVLPTVSDENIGRWNGLDGLLARLRPGQVIASHLRFHSAYPATLAERRTRGIFVIRDPHDIVVSEVHYVSKRTDHRLHGLFTAQADLRERLRLAIVGDPASNLASIGQRLDYFAGWLKAGCLVVRFEDLVGPGGGGDEARQKAAVESIYGFLGLGSGDRLVRSVCDRLFSSDSPTFRKGTVGGWRRFFDPELEAIFNEVVGDRVIPYGYGLTGEL